MTWCGFVVHGGAWSGPGRGPVTHRRWGRCSPRWWRTGCGGTVGCPTSLGAVSRVWTASLWCDGGQPGRPLWTFFAPCWARPRDAAPRTGHLPGPGAVEGPTSLRSTHVQSNPVGGPGAIGRAPRPSQPGVARPRSAPLPWLTPGRFLLGSQRPCWLVGGWVVGVETSWLWARCVRSATLNPQRDSLCGRSPGTGPGRRGVRLRVGWAGRVVLSWAISSRLTGGAGGGEVLVALVELEPKVGGLLFEVG